MNKFGIKVYSRSCFIFDDINWSVNSIRDHYSYKSRYKFRINNNIEFGIKLGITNKDI